MYLRLRNKCQKVKMMPTRRKPPTRSKTANEQQARTGTSTETRTDQNKNT